MSDRFPAVEYAELGPVTLIGAEPEAVGPNFERLKAWSIYAEERNGYELTLPDLPAATGVNALRQGLARHLGVGRAEVPHPNLSTRERAYIEAFDRRLDFYDRIKNIGYWPGLHEVVGRALKEMPDSLDRPAEMHFFRQVGPLTWATGGARHAYVRPAYEALANETNGVKRLGEFVWEATWAPGKISDHVAGLLRAANLVELGKDGKYRAKAAVAIPA